MERLVGTSEEEDEEEMEMEVKGEDEGGGNQGFYSQEQEEKIGARRSRPKEEKERTKLRERHRRAITARILAGLRKHGNYNLRVRADINDVIAALAREAGWVVLPDGTTIPSQQTATPAVAAPPLLPCQTPPPALLRGGGVSSGLKSSADYHPYRLKGVFTPTPVLASQPRTIAMVGDGGELAENSPLMGSISMDAVNDNQVMNTNPKMQERDFAGTPYVPVYVMLPLGVINTKCELVDPDGLQQQLRILKSVNVDGVMVDCWWGIVEAHTPQEYNWRGYKQLFQIVRELKLKLQVVMSFHACGGNVNDDICIPLPHWVTEIGRSNPDIYFTDREGRQNPECLTWGIDKERVLRGRTAVEVYFDYMRSFRVEFDEFFEDGIISEIEVGLGPCGELRYPSYPVKHGWRYPGIGEFQCYDKYLMKSLTKAAEARGHSCWARGPDNAGTYNSQPHETGFFCDGGDYDSYYGRFFLNWYSHVLVDHGNRVLSLSKLAFEGTCIAAKMSEAESNNANENATIDLLSEQETHISSAIYNGIELGTYRCIPTNPDYGTWHLNERQLEYVRMSGLYHLAQMRWIRIDHALITGLVERWRPETNTFHLPIGEATVTLEDVAYIYGLPINGPAVTGTTFPSANVANLCEELLGLRPQMGVDFNGISIKYTWLEQHFRIQADQGNKKKKKKKLSADQEVYNTRAYLFFLVSGQINSNASSSRGPAYALELFRDFKPYAWAPACLANLYRMLNKGVRWAGLKKTDIGSDGKPVGIDPTDESDAFEHTFKSLSGPLQLLQIWAYSRMPIGRVIKPWAWPNNDIQFPLTVTWHNRIGGSHHVTRLRTVRKQLNNLTAEQFDWQPYKRLGKAFLKRVPKEDRNLFRCSAPLIFFWVLERHNIGRVMKQFGLRQVVPPPFVGALPRSERMEKVVTNYSIVHSAEIELWEKRYDSILHGKKSSKVEHTEEYMAWYSLNTIMHIGRPRQDDAPKAAVPEQTGEHEPIVTQKRVFEFFDHIERSCGRAMDKNPAPSMDRFITSLRGKIRKFKSAVEATFDQYTETCSSSQSDEEKQLVRTPRHAVPKKPASKSPGKKKRRGRMPQPQPLNIDDSPLNASPPKNHVQEPKLHYESVYVTPPDEDVSNVPIEDLFSTSPCLEVLTTPPPVQQHAIVVARSPATIESLVWRLKNLPRMRKVPDKLRGFQHSITQSEYILSELDKEILDGFYKYYHSRKTELDAICSMVKSDTLYALLEDDTLLDTNVIYYYFDCIRSSCKDAYLADPSICSWWQGKQKIGDDAAFGPDGSRVWDAKECKTLIYILHAHNHFTLLVGYTDENRWEFYNSSKSDHYHQNICDSFRMWLTQRFGDYGWVEPWVWTNITMTDIPFQQNGTDCGFFAIGYAEHCIHRRPIRFTQADIPYYRRKILVEIFKRSWLMNADRLQLPNFPAL